MYKYLLTAVFLFMTACGSSPRHMPGHQTHNSRTDSPAENSRVLRGHASWYGRKFHGRTTANGEKYNMRDMTAAHKTLPFGTIVEVTDPSTGRSVKVRINDRGPFVKGRIIDLSRKAADRLGIRERGTAPVEVRILK
ncbi:MAG: septal ring lytic transglycosylase RlpA family protein [Fibrobacterota bacterium]